MNQALPRHSSPRIDSGLGPAVVKWKVSHREHAVDVERNGRESLTLHASH